jgi:hypothetical protein
MARLKAKRVNDRVVEAIWRSLLEVFDQNPKARYNATEAARSLAKMLANRTKRSPGRPRKKPIRPDVGAAVERLVTDMEDVHRRFKRLKPGLRERVGINVVVEEFFTDSGLRYPHKIAAAKLLRQIYYEWKGHNSERMHLLDSAAQDE